MRISALKKLYSVFFSLKTKQDLNFPQFLSSNTEADFDFSEDWSVLLGTLVRENAVLPEAVAEVGAGGELRGCDGSGRGRRARRASAAGVARSAREGVPRARAAAGASALGDPVHAPAAAAAATATPQAASFRGTL